MERKESIVFNGVEYRLMGRGTYYLSQSRSNEGRKCAKGLHVAIYEYYSGKKVKKGHIVHHKDGNPFNNEYNNLECITTQKQHMKFHPMKNKEKQIKHLEKIRPLATLWHKSEEGREWHVNHWINSIGKIESKKYNCEYCGKEYESKRIWTRFCSHNCDIKWRYHNQYTIIEKKCVICGKEFETKSRAGEKEGSLTCSFSCRGKLNWQNIRQKKAQLLKGAGKNND